MVFTDVVRERPWSHLPQGHIGRVQIRVGPPRTDEMWDNGVFLSKIFEVINPGELTGQLNPSHPRLCLPRAEISLPLPSGEMRDLAQEYFDNKGGEGRIKQVQLDAGMLANASMTERVAKTAGRPRHRRAQSADGGVKGGAEGEEERERRRN